MALPAPARGFRAGVLSLLYSGGDQSASSFLEAFCLFRRAPSLHPRAPSYGFARSAPLHVTSHHVAQLCRSEFFFLHSASSSPSHFSPDFSFFLSFFLLYRRQPASYACPMRRQDSAIATRPASTDKFHASYTTSSSLLSPRLGGG